MPGSVPGAEASSRSWSSVLPSSSLSCGARRLTGIATSIARLSVGSAPRSSAVRRREVLAEALEVGQERALHAEGLDRDVHRRRRVGDRLLERVLVAAERLEGVGHRGEEVAPAAARRARRCARRRRARRRSAAAASRGRRGCASPARRCSSSRGQLLDRAPDGLAAAGERVAEAAQVLLVGLARLGRRTSSGPRRCPSRRCPGRPGTVSPLCERLVGWSPRRARGTSARAPSAGGSGRSSPRDVADALVELEGQLGHDLAVALAHRAHVVDDADAAAAGADLVAGHEVRRRWARAPSARWSARTAGPGWRCRTGRRRRSPRGP